MFTPPSPVMGSTSTATTSLLCSATVRTAFRSLYGTRLKPVTSGSKPAWILRLPVAESVASVRPWKLPSVTIIVGLRTFCLWPYRRASLIAASLASAPELQKNTLSIWASLHRRSASSACNGISYQFDTCTSLPAWSQRARATDGCAWPRLHTPTPDSASSYFLPALSVSQAPSPRTKATGRGANTGIWLAVVIFSVSLAAPARHSPRGIRALPAHQKHKGALRGRRLKILCFPGPHASPQIRGRKHEARPRAGLRD